MYYLTKEHIYYIHNDTLQKFGGENGYYINTNNMIKSILAQQYTYFGYDKYPTISNKAAMLMYFFVKGHCFVDGNKRVAITSAALFLKQNGCNDYLNDKVGYNKTIEIAESKIPETFRDKYIEDLSNWLKIYFY